MQYCLPFQLRHNLPSGENNRSGFSCFNNFFALHSNQIAFNKSEEKIMDNNIIAK